MFEELEKLESFSKLQVSQIPNDSVGGDIKWFANCVGDYNDEKITQYYLNDEYSKLTRWDTWNDIIKVLLENNIKNVLDIGCANGHFVYLCESKGITSFGLEPRSILVNEYNKKFKEKKLFISTYETFIDFFSKSKIEFKFDCICVLNFFHGEGHNKEYVVKFFTEISKFCNYLVISEANWANYGLNNLTENFNLVCSVGYEKKHKLFKFN